MTLSEKALESLSLLQSNIEFAAQYGTAKALDLGLIDLADTTEQKLWLLNSIVEASILHPGDISPDAAGDFDGALKRILDKGGN